MDKQAALITCTQCGYRFELPNTLRCPRCFKSVITAGSCTGSCSKCKAGQACHNSNNS